MEPLLTSVYVLGLLAGLAGAIADGFINQWAKHGGTQWLVIGFGLSAVMVWIFANMLKREYLGPSLILFVLSNSMFVLIIGRLYFGERLSQLQWFGAGLALVAVFFLEKGK